MDQGKGVTEMDEEEVKAVLAEHKKWLKDRTTGKRANLTWANLTGADLTWATICQGWELRKKSGGD